MWSQCQGTFVDPPLALFAATSVLCLLCARPPTSAAVPGRVVSWLVLAGALHGLACGLRPSAVLLLLPGALYVGPLGLRAVIAFLAPVAVVTAGLTWLDVEVLGRPLDVGWAGWSDAHPPVVGPSYTLGLHGLLFSDGRGLFTLSPILLLAVVAWPGVRRAAPGVAWLFAGYLATLVLFFAAFDGWYGGWCWSARYLLPAVPLLSALVGCWLQRPGPWRRTLAVVLAVVSFCIQVLAVAVPQRIYMVMVTSSPAHVYQYFLYTKYSPVAAHAYILAKKLRGQPDVYSLQELFGDPYDREIDVTEWPWPQVERYSAGFQHLALVRVFTKGHRAAAIAGTAVCLGAIGAGLWLGLRRRRSDAGHSSGPPPCSWVAPSPWPGDPGHGR